jgi:hypothetical protein
MAAQSLSLSQKLRQQYPNDLARFQDSIGIGAAPPAGAQSPSLDVLTTTVIERPNGGSSASSHVTTEIARQNLRIVPQQCRLALDRNPTVLHNVSVVRYLKCAGDILLDNQD